MCKCPWSWCLIASSDQVLALCAQEVGRWAGVDGVRFLFKESIQSACQVRGKGVPLLITDLKVRLALSHLQ